jgi:subtilisin family serine protease
MRKPSIRLVATAALLVFLSTPPSLASAEPPAKGQGSGVYIVQLSDAPVAAYAGTIRGYRATKPQKGRKIDPNAPDVVRYVGYLDSRHDAALAAAGGGRKLYGYRYVFNGFAADLTAQQAARLAGAPGVVAVSKDEARALDTTSTPAFLGLTAPGGLYEQLGGIGRAGEDVIVGIVDGGIWPEHPSFSDRTGTNGNGTQGGKLDYQQIPGWHGRCVPGEWFTAANCNQKLIGARWYNAGWGGDAGIDAQLPHEFNSPRDFGGHGTHTASTAAGNAGVATDGPAAVFGSMGGIAPRARIAAYKVCWQTPAGGSCFTSDSVAAIDQAVADGVDVINYSISGSRTNFRDAVEIAFLFAADAGVFVAVSAGNSGPATSTVAHPGPWLTTVAAGTHNRDGTGSVTLGNGATYTGASLATAAGPAPLIDSTEAGLPGANPTLVALCYAAADNAGNPVLDPAKIAGKIVVCDRGVTARVNKSLAVFEAGGVGMILLNTSAASLNADFHSVPSVHLAHTDRPAVKAYAATAGATATINAARVVYTAAAPFTASFSSRGPLLAGAGDLLKPDLIAPGQDVLAAVAPPGNGGLSFNLYSGTSMSSPHVAGLAALLKNARPDWSPAAIKSALMTTGADVLDGGTPPAASNNPVLIFRQGAGHVRPNLAADPGLVFDADFGDWLGFLCGTQLPTSFCTDAGVPVLDPSDLNVASIAIGDLVSVRANDQVVGQSVKRTVTNVGSSPATYTVSYTGLAGVAVDVSPATFTLAPGASQELAFSFLRTTATFNAYVGGQFTWTDGAHVVRVPAVLRPVGLLAPAEVSGSYQVRFGYDGAFTATARGLVPAAITADTVADDPTDGACSLTVPNAKLVPVAVPAGTTYARFSLFDADVAPGADIDLCVFNSAGTLVGSSGGGTSAEQVNLLNPAAGTYTVVVHGWGVPGTSPFALHTWVLGTASAGNMSVTAPATASIGVTATIDLAFTGLTPGVKYLGSVAYGGVAGLPNPTIVRVDAQ